MSPPLALQLVTVRNEAARDFAGVLDRVAAIGFLGVETVGVLESAGRYGMPAQDSLHGMPGAEFRRRLDDLDLQLIGAFFGPPELGDDGLRFLDLQQELGNEVVVTSLMPDSFASADAIERGAQRCNEVAEIVKERGMTLGYSQHWFEYETAPDGSRPMDAFLERLDPDVFLEMDIYWLQTAGADPASTLEQLGRRVRRLHVMDGPCAMPTGVGEGGVEGEPQTAVGSGSVDIPAALAAARFVDWHVAEFGSCAGDTFETVDASYRYLTENGLSEGRER